MAGFMTKLNGYIYEGELTNGSGSAVENGVLMILGTGANAGKLVFPTAADTTSKFLLKEVTNIYNGTTAYRFVADKLSATYYFIENGFEVDDTQAYDTRTYTTANGAFLRAHPIQAGEEFITTKITGTLAAGTEYGVKTDGSIG